MYPIRYLLLMVTLIFWIAACEFTPKKSAVRTKILGKYCNENHTLILTDSNTYINTKVMKAPASGTYYQESCTGTYTIDMKEGHWVIRFEKSLNPRSVSSCQQEYTLWTEKEGFLIGEKEVTMRDLYDNTPLTKSNCK